MSNMRSRSSKKQSSARWRSRWSYVIAACAILLIVIMMATDEVMPINAAIITDSMEVKASQGSRSWRRLIEQAVAAYQLITPGVTISLTSWTSNYEAPALSATATQLARNMLAANQVDFTLADSAQNLQDGINTPDMASIPFAAQALVMVYNLPGVSDGSLTLTMDITARIFMGNITQWNDPSIVALNPGVALPAATIILVTRSDILSLSQVFKVGLGAYNAAWKAATASSPTGLIYFPYTTGSLSKSNFFQHGTAMSTIPYTFSYMWLDEANNLGVAYTNILSPAGALLKPTSDSVLYTVMEKGGIPVTPGQLLVDMTGPTGPAAWPMCNYAFAIVRKTAFRYSCSIKTAGLKFLYWFYTSETAATLAASMAFVIPPQQIRTSQGIENLINNNVFCSGSLAYPVERTLTSLGVGTAMASPLFQIYPPVYKSVAATTGTISYAESDSDAALNRLMYGEVDFAITVATSMRADLLEDAILSGAVSQLPLFAVRYVMLFNLPGMTSDDDGVIFDYATLSDVWQGKITLWNDKRITDLNPDLLARGLLPLLNITRVVPTAGSREVDRRFFGILNQQTVGTDAEFPLTLDSTGLNLPFASSPWLVNQTNIVYVSNEGKIQAAVGSQKGAIGIVSVSNALESTAMKSRLQKKDGTIVADSVTASYKCLLDSFNATTMRFRPSNSKISSCWTFTTFIYTMVRMANIGDQCVNAPRALKFLQFLHDQTSVNAEAAAFLDASTLDIIDGEEDDTQTAEAAALARSSLVAEQLGALWAPPAVRALVQAKLKQVTCDGETILVTLPVDHRIGMAAESAALGITVLGCACIALILCFLYFFHLRSAIKASSPIFLLGTVIGLLMLWISGTLLAQDTPTNVTCGAGWWMLNIGFYMTFGPLFAKCWRIYKIFMRKEMTVVRLTDWNLMTRLFVGLAFELMLLGIMHGVAPFRAFTVVQSALPRDQTIYYCSTDDISIAAVLGGYKGLMLLFGAMMSFSTRSVSENFNESKPIAFSIYNVLFTACIIIPIALLNQSDGRTLYLLAVFAVYWITMTTFVIVFSPKVIAIYKDASGLLAQRISDSKASASEIASRSAQMGRTIKELAQQPVRLMDRTTLRTYVALLEKELTMARAALATLDANEGVLAGGGMYKMAAGGPQQQGGGTGSANNSRGDTAGMIGVSSAMTPGGANRTMATGGTPRAGAPGASGGFMMPNMGGNAAASGGRPYATGSSSPKGAGATRELPGMVRTGSTFTKYTVGAASGTNTPVLMAAPQPNAAATAASQLSSSSVPGVRSTASIAPSLSNASPATLGITTSNARATSPGSVSVGLLASTPAATRHLSAVEMKAIPASPSNSSADPNNGGRGPSSRAVVSGLTGDGDDDFSLPPAPQAQPATRFRMPASLGLGGTSHGALSPIASSPPAAMPLGVPPTISTGSTGNNSPPTQNTTLAAAARHHHHQSITGDGSGGRDGAATPGSTNSNASSGFAVTVATPNANEPLLPRD